MRRLHLSTAAILMLSVPCALAADLPAAYKSPAPAFAASPWDGPYIGANIGFGNTDFDATASLWGRSASATQSASGIVGGVEAGYNKQFGSVVIGLETDFDGTSISGTTGGVETKMPWFGTTRARAGFLLTPSLLVYGTGGVAYGRVEVTAPNVSITIPGVGWAAGGGAQFALGGGWFVGAEYLHVNLDGPGADIGALHVATKATTDLGRAKVDFKF